MIGSGQSRCCCLLLWAWFGVVDEPVGQRVPHLTLIVYVLVASSLLSRLLHIPVKAAAAVCLSARRPSPARTLSPLRSRGSWKPSLALGPPVLAAHSRCDAHSLRRDASGTLSTGDRHRSVPDSAVARGGSAEASLPLESCCYFPPIHPRMQYIGLVGLVFSLLQLRRGRVRSARSRASLLRRSSPSPPRTRESQVKPT